MGDLINATDYMAGAFWLFAISGFFGFMVAGAFVMEHLLPVTAKRVKCRPNRRIR